MTAKWQYKNAYEAALAAARDLKDENARLREFARRAYGFSYNCYHGAFDQEVFFDLRDRIHDLGIEVDV